MGNVLEIPERQLVLTTRINEKLAGRREQSRIRTE